MKRVTWEHRQKETQIYRGPRENTKADNKYGTMYIDRTEREEC